MTTRRQFALAVGALGIASTGLTACGPSEVGGGPGQIVFALPPAIAAPGKWQGLIADMRKATGLTVHPFAAPDDEASVEAMKSGRVGAGWFTSQAGLAAQRLGDGEVFARTLAPSGIDGYQSVLVVSAKSSLTPERILKCDKALTYGQGKPSSISAYLAPVGFFFAPAGADPKTCFKAIHTGDHPANLAAVAAGKLDVAATNSEFLDSVRQARPHEADAVRVIWSSPTLPQDPILWRKDLDPDVKERLRQFFFTYARGDAAEAQRQRDNLTPLGIGGFTPADNNQLLMAREIEARLRWAEAEWSGDAAKIAAARKVADAAEAQRLAFEGRVGAAQAQ